MIDLRISGIVRDNFYGSYVDYISDYQCSLINCLSPIRRNNLITSLIVGKSTFDRILKVQSLCTLIRLFKHLN